jgi:hypothetical protein
MVTGQVSGLALARPTCIGWAVVILLWCLVQAYGIAVLLGVGSSDTH